MRVLAVVHGDLVGPERFGEVIRAEGHQLREWQIAGGGSPPTADAVLVLGGDANVGEEERHPWLRREYELLRGWVDRETPLLGICLGAQTLAHAHGGRVAALHERLAGFVELALTDAGRADPLLGALPPRFPALFANAYGFELPPRAVALATSSGAAQAYRIGPRAWGVQFHPEALTGQVLAWWRAEEGLPLPLPELERALRAGMPAWDVHGRTLCRAFLEAARAG